MCSMDRTTSNTAAVSQPIEQVGVPPITTHHKNMMDEEGVRSLFVLSPFVVREYSEVQIYVVGDCQIAIVLHPATARSMESTNVHLQLCVWYTVPALRLSFLRPLAAAKGEERHAKLWNSLLPLDNWVNAPHSHAQASINIIPIFLILLRFCEYRIV